MKWLALVLAVIASVANAQTLRIGLAEDPDILDPTMARTFVGRIVFAGLCDKLFDLDEKLNVVPQLATSYKWSADNKALEIKLRSGVTFHDGEKLDAEAAKFNLERHKNTPGSPRRTASSSSATPATGTRLRSTSIASSTSRSSIRRFASPTCARASSTSSSASLARTSPA